ncbi:MAG: hypothetical protein ACLQGP_22770 [Isosphaeraceae bacterium]
MRQVGDMLVWLAVILVVAGVVYYTPRVANYVTREPRPEPGKRIAWGPAVHPVYGSAEESP